MTLKTRLKNLQKISKVYNKTKIRFMIYINNGYYQVLCSYYFFITYFRFVISFSIFWFNLGGWLAIAPTATASLFGTQNYSRNYGIVFTAYGIGAVLGVMGSGLIVDLIGSYKAIFYLVIALCILGCEIVVIRK